MVYTVFAEGDVIIFDGRQSNFPTFDFWLVEATVFSDQLLVGTDIIINRLHEA
jgi:hypothetical protein